MNGFTKKRLGRTLLNVGVCLIGISGLSMLFAYVTKLVGLIDLANMLAVGSIIGVMAAIVFGLCPWIFPEWYGISSNADSTQTEKKNNED